MSTKQTKISDVEDLSAAPAKGPRAQGSMADAEKKYAPPPPNVAEAKRKASKARINPEALGVEVNDGDEKPAGKGK